jgi:hypothetical protein
MEVFKFRQFMKQVAILLWMLITLGACTEEAKRSMAGPRNAYGKLNDLVVVSEAGVWDGPVGDTIDYYFGAAYPILPQPEPMYDIRQFDLRKLEAEPLLRELRTYLIVANLADEDAPVSRFVRADLGEKNYERARADNNFNTMVGKNRWAKGQLVIYIFSFSEDDLIKAITKSFSAVSKRIRESEVPHMHKRLFVGGQDFELHDKVMEKDGISLKVPKGWFVALQKPDVTWLRMETEKASSNILISKIPYTSEVQLSKAGIKEIRNKLGRKYVSSRIQGSYMVINDVDLPMYTYVKTVNNRYTVEARGIWELENDYMGGPFISYLIHNKEKGELVFLDGFVYAPEEDKRNYIQYLEHILSEVKI